MARYILIDSNSGYIFFDSADLPALDSGATPVDVARAGDESIGEHGRSYDELPFGEHRNGRTGYLVYRADVRGAEQVGNIHDGQDPELIAAVQRDCEEVCFIAASRAED